MRYTLNFIVLSLILAACADNASQDTTHNRSRADTATQIDTMPKTLAASVTTSSNSDTLVVDRQAAIFIEPDSIKIEKQKKKVFEDDFYTVADDYVFYINTAHKFLDSVKLATLNATDKKFIKFVRKDKTHQIINVDKLPELWSIYFFDPAKKAKQVDMTMVDEEYKSYFK